MDSLKGWKTYLIFGATLIISVAAKTGQADADPEAVGRWVTLITDPALLSIVALLMRKLTKGPAAV